MNTTLTSARNKPEICLQIHHTVLEIILVQRHTVCTSSQIWIYDN